MSMREKGPFRGTAGSHCISPTNVELCKTKKLFPTHQEEVTKMQLNEREGMKGQREEGTSNAF